MSLLTSVLVNGTYSLFTFSLITVAARQHVAFPARFELTTLALEGRCSIQLSYGNLGVHKGGRMNAWCRGCELETKGTLPTTTLVYHEKYGVVKT